MSQIEGRVSSGLSALDAILDGGFVRKRINLIEGTPGTGKTTVGLQFLMAGRRHDEKTLYITLSETAEELRAVAEAHKWSLEGIEIFELAPSDETAHAQTVFHSSEVELGETARQIFQKIDDVKPARMVLDSLSEMRLLAQSPLRYRRQILALKQFLAKKNVTVLLLDDMTSETHDLQVHSIAHGVITLEQIALEYGAERRRLRVRKMRGVRFHGGYHDYIIRTGGLEVFPRLSAIAPEVRQEKQIVRSSSPQLDQMLGGGLQRGTSTLLIGPAGSGKSSIALTYLTAAAARGEFSALFAFDETIESIYDRSAGVGLALEPLVKAQKISVDQINPADMSPGEFTQLVCDKVEKKGARVIVIDSLNGLLNSMPEERHLILQVHELLSYLSVRGVLTILIIAQHGMVGAMQNPLDLSYLSDNVLLLRYFEAEGKLRKAISVMKKRVGSHEDSIRELRISGEGLQVGEPLTQFQGILTGVPNYLGPQKLLKAN
ncbi:MAG TPA: ATPase domain-containing protein [Alphaproteobacteria bacterium]|nr:ATPase domain-containing protein [Alphaproteobacteria bacterium]